MNKKFLITLILISMLLFNSCSFIGFGDSSSFAPADNSIEKAEVHVKQVIEALQNRNKDALRAMFSKKALTEAEDIDGRMDYLFDFFQGKVISLDPQGDGGSDTIDFGHEIKEMKAWFYINTDKQKYLIYIFEYVVDTDHPDNVGLYMLQIIKAEDRDKEFDIGQDTLCAGIYMPPVAGAPSASSATCIATL